MLVLCKYEVKDRFLTSGGVMVEVDSSKQILDTFNQRMKKSYGHSFAPVEMLWYLPQCNKRRF